MSNDPIRIQQDQRHEGCAAPRAFTRTELLVVIAVTSLWGFLLVPTLARSNPNGAAFQCMNNLRQLTAAWKMYADDHNDQLVASDSVSVGGRPPWVQGYMNFAGGNRSNWDVTLDIEKSPLWPYIGNHPELFKCPADKATVLVSGQRLSRVRSISMSQVFGMGSWLPSTMWRTYATAGEIVNPAKTFLLADEHPDSINDAALLNQQVTSPSSIRIIDYPGSYHDGACTISFADSHVEVHQWQDPRTTTPMVYLGVMQLNVASPNNPDMLWLSERTTVRR